MRSLPLLSGGTMVERDKLSRQEIRASGRALLSVITPAYNEADNLRFILRTTVKCIKIFRRGMGMDRYRRPFFRRDL